MDKRTIEIKPEMTGANGVITANSDTASSSDDNSPVQFRKIDLGKYFKEKFGDAPSMDEKFPQDPSRTLKQAVDEFKTIALIASERQKLEENKKPPITCKWRDCPLPNCLPVELEEHIKEWHFFQQPYLDSGKLIKWWHKNDDTAEDGQSNATSVRTTRALGGTEVDSNLDFVCLWVGCKSYGVMSTRNWLQGHIQKYHVPQLSKKSLIHRSGIDFSKRSSQYKHAQPPKRYDDYDDALFQKCRQSVISQIKADKGLPPDSPIYTTMVINAENECRDLKTGETEATLAPGERLIDVFDKRFFG